MNSREKFAAIMDFDGSAKSMKVEYGYWVGTIKRFFREGLPRVEEISDTLLSSEGVEGGTKIDPGSGRLVDKNVRSYFKLDSYLSKIPMDISPGLKKRIIEDNEKYRIYTDNFGITQKIIKGSPSMPLYMDYPVKDRKDFHDYIQGYDGDIDKRFPENWDQIRDILKDRDYPVRLGGNPFGFFGFPRHIMGNSNFFIKMHDDPELIKDINEFILNFIMNYWSRILDEVEVDCVWLFEDMAYRSGSLISREMFEEFLSPYYKKFTDFLKQYKVKTIIVDSDGFIEELIPLWIKCGVTGIVPLEMQAGNDMARIRKKYPGLQLMGGINKMMLSQDKGKSDIDKELSKVPALLKEGGYIPHIDHYVHEDASWENFKYYRESLNNIIENS